MVDATDNAKNQARAQLDSILAFMAAIDCDFARWEELGETSVDDMSEGEKEEFNELEEQAGEYTNSDEAREAAQENALSIEVRSEWQSLGETLEPSEFSILLCTGGPAVRIIGELNGCKEPSRARLQYQDWGTGWTDFFDFKDGESQALLEYTRLFYFGE